ncbi:unnamed protein product [Symbiodinium sp. CCMP2592]|nr:unnamed protein product [Symbiodinium sp. CCMP2592]
MLTSATLPVIVDLTHVGGHYLADTVVASVSVSDFINMYAHELDTDPTQVSVYVCNGPSVTLQQDRLTHSAGDVVIFLRSDSPPPQPAHDIAPATAAGFRGDLEDMPRLSFTPSVAVAFREQIHTFYSGLFAGRDMQDVLCERFGVTEQSAYTLSTSSVSALAIRGHACPTLCAILEMPSPRQLDIAIPEPAADWPLQGWDCLCDLRPLGLAPVVLRFPTHECDLPRLIGSLGLELDDGWMLRITDVSSSSTGRSELPVLLVVAHRAEHHDLVSHGTTTPAATVAAGSALFSAPSVADHPPPMLLRPARQTPADDSEPSDADTSDYGSHRETIEGQALLLVLDKTTQAFDFSVSAPATVPELIDAIDEQRTQTFYLQYPNIVEAVHQPSAQWATLIALPCWTAGDSLVLLDLRCIDGRFFLVEYPDIADRAGMLALAGLPDDDSASIYPYGRTHPLQDEETIPLLSRGTIAFVRVADPVPRMYHLAGMLSTPAEWDLDVEVPRGPGGLYTVQGSPGRHYLEHLATEYDTPLHWTTVQVAHPRVFDAAHNGYRCRGVAMLSVEIPNVPVPPGIPMPGTFLIALDCRPIFQGWHQYLVQDWHCSHVDLVQLYDTFAPDQFQVQIEGAAIADDGVRLLVTRGQVLVVMWVPVTPASHASPEGPRQRCRLTPSSECTDSHDDGDTSSSTQGASLRSRSPRQVSGQNRTTLRGASQGLTILALASQPTVGAAMGWLTAPSSGQLLDGYFPHALRIVVTAACALGVTHGVDTLGLLGSVPATVAATIVRHFVHAMATFFRLLLEPACDSLPAYQALSALRRATGNLGGFWRHLPLEHNDPFLSDDDSVLAASDTESIAWATVLILAPAYTPEVLQVAIQFPASCADTEVIFQQERDPERATHFPVLVAAHPQTVNGAGVYLALPHWDPDLCAVVIDAMRTDGRLYAVASPAYVDRLTVLRLAGAEPTADVDVYVAGDTEPLQPGTFLHVVSGCSIVILPRGSSAPQYCDIGIMLQRPSMWSQDFILPSAEPDSYCVVMHQQLVLYQFPGSDPTRFRQQLANALQVRIRDLALYPARPRVTDAVVDGHTCRAVVAADAVQTTNRPSDHHVILIDCRPLMQGWRVHTVQGGHVHVDRLREALAHLAPEPHSLYLPDVPIGDNLFRVAPGTVLVAAVALQPPLHQPHARDAPDLRQDLWPLSPATGSPQALSATAHATPGQHDASLPQLTGTAASNLNLTSEGAEAEPVTGHDEDTTHTGVGVFTAVTFQVFIVGSPPELYSVRLAMPHAVHPALARVSAMRLPAPKRRFPRLIPVFPQPSTSVASVVATPVWDPQGVIACFASIPGNTVFCMDVPPLLTRRDVLRISGLPDEADVDVYHRDVPWPVISEARLQVQDGDLFWVVHRPHLPPTPRSLLDLLLRVQGWGEHQVPPPPQHDLIWVIADQMHFSYIVQPGRRHFLRQDLSVVLGCRGDSLVLRPAIGATDYSHRGVTARAVLVAHVPIDESPRRTPRPPYALLDLRPLLLGFSWAEAPNGDVDHLALRQRFAARCPLGFVLACTDIAGDTSPLTHDIRVQDSDTLVLEYLTHAEAAASHSLPAPTGLIPSGGPGYIERHDMAPQGPTSGQTDAGTGGTNVRSAERPPFSTSAAHPIQPLQQQLAQTFSRVVMWILALLGQAFTSVLLCYGPAVLAKLVQLFLRALLSLAALQRRRAVLACVCLWVLCWPTLVLAAPATENPAVGTPCLGTAAACAFSAFTARAVATPCRSNDCPPLVQPPPLPRGYWPIPGPTLLEQCFFDTDGAPYFDAVALLETLEEFFAGKSVKQNVVSIALADALPLTDYQMSVETLRALVPIPASAEQADWLDNDLTSLMQPGMLSVSLQAQLDRVPRWHRSNQAATDVREILVFTDGSAATDPDDILPCSWAFTVWVSSPQGLFFYGGAAGQAAPPETPYHVGEFGDHAVTAELLALFWALVWAAEYGPALQAVLTFYFDAESVGRSVFGEWRQLSYPHHTGRPSLLCLAVSLRQYAACLCPVRYGHVKGHSGTLGNEVTDVVAKTARRSPGDFWSRCLPPWPAQLAAHPLSLWLWLLAGNHADIPTLFAFESEATRLRSIPAHAAAAPSMGIREIKSTGKEVLYDLTCVTFNVLTMRDHSARSATTALPVGLQFLGRRALLQQELAPHKPLFVGFQETRLPDSALAPDSQYFILQSSATAEGSGGCALWIAKQTPYARIQGQRFYFQEQHFVVSGHSDRHLTVSISAPHLRLLVIVAHCPSLANHSADVVVNFWQARHREIVKRPSGSDFIILVDSNAQVGGIETEHISAHQAEPENHAGALFHDFLTGIFAFLPSTFQEVHTGPGHTWCSARGFRHRLDYIVLPLSWRDFQLSSRTLPGFEAMQLREDHTPVLLQARFGRPVSDLPYFDCRRRCVRPNAPATADEQRARCELLHSLPSCPWHADVDQQFEAFVRQWRCAGEAMVDSAPVKAHQSFLTDTTLDLVGWCKALRCYLHAESRERDRRWYLLVFAAFRLAVLDTNFQAEAVVRADLWFWELDHSEARAISLLHRFVKRLRQGVTRDRLAYLQSLVKQVSTQDLKDPASLYKAIRRAFPTARSARRSGLRPLPAVLDSGGVYAATPEARAECWRSHFSDQEAGRAVTSEEYLRAFRGTSVNTAPFDIASVPTLCSLEGIALQLKSHKACGPDGLSPDLLKVCPVATARSLAPIALKTTLSLREPVEFRGGTLTCLAKKIGVSLQCSHYRSILISSVPAKILHRHVRNLLVPVHASTKPALQLGALGGIGIEAVSLTARSFQLFRHTKKLPWSLIFVDVQAAFYRVIRQALIPGVEDDTELLRVFHRMGLPPAAIIALKERLQGLAILPELGTPAQVVAMVQDMMRATWFRIDTHSILTMTACGTRPGDPAADMLFALAFGEFLKSLDSTLGQAGLHPSLPEAPLTTSWAHRPSEATVGAPAWADDFFVPQTADSPETLLDRTRRTVAHTAARASALGMRLTYAPTKTAVLLPAGVDWQQHSQHVCAFDDTLCLQFVDELTGEAWDLPIVHAYRHLGGILTSSTNPRPDLLLRQSQALGYVKPLRKKLFANRDVPLKVRSTVLQALSGSRLVHSAAALVLPSSVHQRLWDRAYVQVWRALSPRLAADKQLHSLDVLRLAQAPSPPLAIAKARAAFLKQLTLHGPSILRWMLFQFWSAHPRSSWLQQLDADIKLVLTYVPDVAPVFHGRNTVAVLLDSLVEDAGWWLRQVRQAQASFLRDLERVKDTPQPRIAAAVEPPPSAADRTFRCPLCPAAFVLRKHLAAHQARSHKIWCPARHFAFGPYCLACHRWTGDIRSVQIHLKRTDACLRRMCRLVPPMTTEQIRQVEHDAVIRERQLRRGQWTSFRGRAPTSVVYGPFLSTADERLAGLDFFSEEVTLDVFRPIYRPPDENLAWVESYLAARSKEGPRPITTSYWHRGPFCKSHPNSNIFGMRRE